MKQTTTEIFIEVEETICLKSSARKKPSNQETAKESKPVIEICPHCHQANFQPEAISQNAEKRSK